MSGKRVKKIILSMIAGGSGGGIIKVAVDSSSGGIVAPLSDPRNAFTPPPEQLNSNSVTESDNSIKRDRVRRDLSESAHQTNEVKQFQGTRWQDYRPATNKRYRNPFDPFSHIDHSPTGRGEAWEKVNKPLTDREKESVRKEAKGVLGTLNDYTFKIFGPCVYGTGWILDYKLPNNPDSYPTTWYIVTNAHVISNFRFGENPYEQILPHDHEVTQTTRNQHDYDNMLKRWSGSASLDDRSGSCDAPSKYGYFDLNIAQQDYEGVNITRKADRGLIGQGKIKEPKLFFSAIDFLKENPNKDINFGHYADFAVIEIEFNSENDARTITGKFADKYDLYATNTLNVFADPLEKKYTKEELNNYEDNIYIVAYPGGKNNKWWYTDNFNSDTAIASHLGGTSHNERKERYEDGYRGFVKAQDIKHGQQKIFRWKGNSYKEFGHYYEIQHHPLERGSSGGVFADKNLDALAVTAVTTVGVGSFTSWILPLRSEGITFKKGFETITTPKYDLILGGENHKNSYKQQVEKYITSKGERTWLSARNWRQRDKNRDSDSWILIDSYSDF